MGIVSPAILLLRAQRQTASVTAPQVATYRGSGQSPALHPVSVKKPRTNISHAVVASGPKLDQFPSPRPLSEQEKFSKAT